LVWNSTRSTATAAGPREREAWRDGLTALDAEAKRAYGARFRDLAELNRDALLAQMQNGELKSPAWGSMTSEAFFKMRLARDIVLAYYAHPTAWNEIGWGGPAYVPRARISPPEVVALIADAGGVVSLAHPARIPNLEALLATLVPLGLAGLETYYGEYPPETVARLAALASRFDLVPTGGSDYHGRPIKDHGALGARAMQGNFTHARCATLHLSQAATSAKLHRGHRHDDDEQHESDRRPVAERLSATGVWPAADAIA